MKSENMNDAKDTKINDFQSRRKQDNIEPREVRQHQVKVTLNDAELAFLDSVRGHVRRAEAMRFLLQENPPKTINALNSIAYQELARSAANLNQIAHKLNAGEIPEIEEIKTALAVFRGNLLGAEL